MKKLMKWMPAAFAAMTMVACSVDDVSQQAPAFTKSLKATIEGETATRATINDTKIVWTDNDAFKVFNASGDADVYTIAGGSGSESANFGTTTTNVSDGAETYAAFPADNVTSLTSDVLTMTLPASYNFDTQAVDGDNLMKTVVPMWANFSTEGLSFKHLGAVMQLTFKDLPEGSTEVIFEGSQNLSGTFTATLTDAEPKLVYSTGGGNTVTVSFTATTATEDRVFFVPVPAGTYDMTVKVKIGGNIKTLKTWEAFTFARKGLYRASVTYKEIEASTPAEVSAMLDEALTGATAGQNIEIMVTTSGSEGIKPADTDDSETTYDDRSTAIEVPQVEGAKISLTFEDVPVMGATPLQIKEKEGATGVTSNSLSISMPDNGGKDVALDIDLPKTTVTLEGSGSTGTTYKTITAKTAANTLVLSSGVTVESLTVTGGNVSVDGGKVLALGAALPEGSTITLVTDNDGNVVLGGDNKFYASVRAAFSGGATKATLLRDIDEGQFLYYATEGGAFTLNLDGHKMNLTDSQGFGIYVAKGTYVINGGEGGQIDIDVASYPAYILSGAALQLNNVDVNVVNENPIYAVLAQGNISFDGVNFTLKNNQYGIYVYASSTTTIENSSIINENTGNATKRYVIYNLGDLTVNNSKIYCGRYVNSTYGIINFTTSKTITIEDTSIDAAYAIGINGSGNTVKIKNAKVGQTDGRQSRSFIYAQSATNNNITVENSTIKCTEVDETYDCKYCLGRWC